MARMPVSQETSSFIIVSMVALCLVLGSVSLAGMHTVYMAGWHNLDRGWNLKLLNDIHNMTFSEIGIDYVLGHPFERTPEELILLGQFQMFRGAGGMATVSMMFGIAIGVLLAGFVLRTRFLPGKEMDKPESGNAAAERRRRT